MATLVETPSGIASERQGAPSLHKWIESKHVSCTSTACSRPGHTKKCVLQATDAMGLVRHQALQSRQQLAKVSVLASAFLLSVVLGNVALRYIPVSFSQVSPAAYPVLHPARSQHACWQKERTGSGM